MPPKLIRSLGATTPPRPRTLLGTTTGVTAAALAKAVVLRKRRRVSVDVVVFVMVFLSF
jgi:cobalamin biosynthesis protein CbiD